MICAINSPATPIRLELPNVMSPIRIEGLARRIGEAGLTFRLCYVNITVFMHQLRGILRALEYCPEPRVSSWWLCV